MALNPDGNALPAISASYVRDADDLRVLVDGRYGLTTYQANRWVTTGTPNDEDWIRIDFGTRQLVSQVDVYLWGDAPRYLGRRDTTVTAPRAMRVEVQRGDDWAQVEDLEFFPVQPLAMARNIIRFSPAEASAVRVTFVHDRPAVTGVSELQVW
jgi:hypothetical protein